MSSARSTVYRVELSARAESDMQSIYDEIGANHSEASIRWYNRLESLVLSLNRLPGRGTLTREDRTFRHLLFGNKPHVYRVIYLWTLRPRPSSLCTFGTEHKTISEPKKILGSEE